MAGEGAASQRVDHGRIDTARVVEAAFLLQKAGYGDVAKFLLAAEGKASMAAKGTRRRGVKVRLANGRPAVLDEARVRELGG